MILAFSWVPKGAAKAIPDRAELLSKEEIEKLKESCDQVYSEDEEDDTEDENKNGEVAHAKAVAEAFGRSSNTKNASSSMEVDGIYDDLMKELDMDNYDEEDDVDEMIPSLLYFDPGIEIFSFESGGLYYASNDMDPYLKNHDDSDESDEDEDQTILPTKSMIVCAKTDDEDASYLDVCVCEETSNGYPNICSRGRFELPTAPLCTAWLDCPLKGGEKGNFLAVGLYKKPMIEIWDLDVKDEVLPCVQLGGKEKGNYKEGSHTRSVLGLAWNKEFGYVQAVAWNHYAPEVLLSGSFDQTVVLVSLKNGSVKGFDVRQASNSASDLKPSFTLQAHHKPATCVSYNISAPNLLATGSMDKTVKLWDLSDNKPSCIASHIPNAGAYFPLISLRIILSYSLSVALGGI
ncbi:hypothetical protein Bca101_060116 [Brassica carinata]